MLTVHIEIVTSHTRKQSNHTNAITKGEKIQTYQL